MKFEVRNRFSGAVQFTAEIEASDDTPTSIRLGLAVKWAFNSGAYLSGAYLSGAYLSGADLSGADLSGAYLSGAYLSRAYLSRAYLSRADLSRADLSGAYLSGADLSGANLSRAYGIAPELCTDLLILYAQPGPKLRAYKLVDDKYRSPIQARGKLTYKLGATVSAKDVNTDPSEHCGAGVNVATLTWCLRNWEDGYRILLVEFDKADLACIPTATDGKFRVKSVQVIEELTLDYVALGLKKASAEQVAA